MNNNEDVDIIQKFETFTLSLTNFCINFCFFGGVLPRIFQNNKIRSYFLYLEFQDELRRVFGIIVRVNHSIITFKFLKFISSNV